MTINYFNFTVGDKALEDWKIIGSYDIAGSYEVDEGAVYLLPDNRVYYRYASGCSCWDGKFDSDLYDNFDSFVRFGIDEYRLESMTYEIGFQHLHELAISLKKSL